MIREIRIRNFRSLRDVVIQLGDVTVLVGKSGTGKSNFVRAIRFLRDYLLTGDKEQASKGGFCQLEPAGMENFVMGFQIHFEIKGIPEAFKYALQLPCGNGINGEQLQLGDKTLFHYQNNGWLVPPDVSPVPDIQAPMLGRLPAVSAAVIAYSALTTGIGCYEFPLGVLSEPKASSPDGLDDAGHNFLGVLKAIYSNLRDLNLRRAVLASVACLNETIDAVELDSIATPRRVFVTHRFNGTRQSFDLTQESAGFRRFLAHILAIYQEPPKQVLVFEEPENGIYPGALGLLAEELRGAPLLDRGQVILTTHSPELLNHFAPDELRVVTLVNGATHIGIVSAEQVQGVNEQLLTTGELLTVDPVRPALVETGGP